jgi:hypothetical protein
MLGFKRFAESSWQEKIKKKQFKFGKQGSEAAMTELWNAARAA